MLRFSLILWLFAVVSANAAVGPSERGEPKESDLVEQTGTERVQLDVIVTMKNRKVGKDGEPRFHDALQSLTEDDFHLAVGGRPIERFDLDNLCGTASVSERVAEEPQRSATGDVPEERFDSNDRPASSERPAAHFLFYFDQMHLTMAGRNNAMKMARELIPALVRGPNRAMIVSSGRELKTFAPWTADQERLLEGIGTMERDSSGQWVYHADDESRKLAEIIEMQNDLGTTLAKRRAYQLQKEAIWHTSRALKRLELTLGSLTSLLPPKIVIYFADTMRQKPGAFYTGLFAQRGDRDPVLRDADLEGFMSAQSLQNVMDAAATHGVRVYAIEPQGMRAPDLGGGFKGQNPTSFGGTARIDAAQGSLISLAHETGGEAFTGAAASSQRVVRRIETDLRCFYLISFDPKDLKRDVAHPVRLTLLRKGVNAFTRGTVLIQSREKRLTSRLLSAFVTPQAVSRVDEKAIGSMIPLGIVPNGRRGRYLTRVQAAVDQGSPSPDPRFDLGFSLLSRGEVKEEISQRIDIEGGAVEPNRRIVLEADVEILPGPFEIVIVGHDRKSDQIVRGSLKGTLPHPGGRESIVSPIALVQPAGGVFLRQGTTRDGTGALALGERMLDSSKMAVAMAVICLGKRERSQRWVEVALGPPTEGATEPGAPDDVTVFSRDLLEFEPDQRCISFRKEIPPDLLSVVPSKAADFELTIGLYASRESADAVATAKRRFTAYRPASADEHLGGTW